MKNSHCIKKNKDHETDSRRKRIPDKQVPFGSY